MKNNYFLVFIVFLFLVVSQIFTSPTHKEHEPHNKKDRPKKKPYTPMTKEEWKKKAFEIFKNVKVPQRRAPTPAKSDVERFLRRLAASGIDLNMPGFIPLSSDDKTQSSNYYAYRHVLNNLKKTKSQYLVYPYDFEYDDAGEKKTIPNGGFINLKPENMNGGQFSYVKTNTSVHIGKSKALYDTNIAIMKYEMKEEEWDGLVHDMFYESDNVCSLLKTTFAKFTSCLKGIDAFNQANTQSTSIVYTDIYDILEKDGLFSEDGSNRFGILIFPDVYQGMEWLFYDMMFWGIGKYGFGGEAFQKFVEQGGVIVSMGKSNIIMELLEVVEPGTFDPSSVIVAKTNDPYIPFTDYQIKADDTYEERLLKMNLEGRMYAISSYPVNGKAMAEANDFKVIAEWDIYDKNFAVMYAGTQPDYMMNYTYVNRDQVYCPAILYREYGKGKVVIFNGNPLYNIDNYNGVINAYILALSKPVVLDMSIRTDDGLPIPGGEAGTLVQATVDFFNTFDKVLPFADIYAYFPDGVEPTEYDKTKCSWAYDKIPEVTLGSPFNTSRYLKCSMGEVAEFAKYNYVIKMEIKDAKVTQKATDISLIYPYLQYQDSETDRIEFVDSGGLKVNAALGALLRGAINPDPTGFYPFLGKGFPTDNDLTVENKENTAAKEVVYYGVLPLIAPLVDSTLQDQLVTYLEFDAQYYNERKYTFPYEENSTTSEYIDFYKLENHSVVLGADWDQTVTVKKMTRTSAGFDYEEPSTTRRLQAAIGASSINVENSCYSTSVGSNQMVIEQANSISSASSASSEFFVEEDTQRLMVFVDTSTAEGYSFMNEEKEAADSASATGTSSSMHTIEASPTQTASGATVGKKKVLFVRNDIFFYNNSDYSNPKDLNQDHIISVDEYEMPDMNKCNNFFGKQESYIMKEGVFNSEQGLVPSEWANKMFLYCPRQIIKPTSENFVSPTEDLKYIHYLVPCNEGGRAGEIEGFIEDDADGSGHHTLYKDLKYVFGHEAQLSIPGETTRTGGRLRFKLEQTFKDSLTPEEVIENNYISYSADQVAFYKTIYNDKAGEFEVYFKRGSMPDEAFGKPSQIKITIEKLTTDKDFTMDIQLDELKYDISNTEDKENQFEDFITQEPYEAVSFTRRPYYSMPAVEIANHLKRDINPYELLSPYTRYGVYHQELFGHRTLYSYMETHNIGEPGLVLHNSGFSTISNIGTASIPTREFVTKATILIPYCARTSRLQWKDIWGRNWAQPLRSIFIDSGGAVDFTNGGSGGMATNHRRNFVMRTTFELLSTKGERLFEWPSDEEAYIHVQMKFLNNYPKYFVPISCAKNSIPYIKKKPDTYAYDRRYTDAQIDTEDAVGVSDADMDKDNMAVSFAFQSKYGMCYNSEGSLLNGNKVSSSSTTNTMVCGTESITNLKECEETMKNTPALGACSSTTSSELHNYSPDVEQYYPKGYINTKMWNMVENDYDDNTLDKGYKYHMDNNLPSLDVCPAQNPGYEKPHNVVTFPIFKGFGYQMEYDKTMSLPNDNLHKGWWSDQLQNKDDTLLAGQDHVNEISVGQETLLPDDKWINVKEMDTGKSPYLVERLKNMYTCKFNQHRIKVKPNQKIFAFPENVYQNNVVPVDPNLEDTDDKLTKYDCSNESQYSPLNISQFDNKLVTATDRDWLYFAVNLRGGAKENIHVALKLVPFGDRKYEGITKVQDGGRFTYWNPSNGPNTFLMMDNVVNTVESYRVDLSFTVEVIPVSIPTYNSRVYSIFTVSDANEKLRQYSMNTYTNSYGFGDSTITVYVGGTKDSSCKIGEGETTYVKITFYNNCGFDWHLYNTAIDFEGRGEKFTNANELLYDKIHFVKAPTKYNFMTPELPEDLKGYIEIVPSDHNIETAPQFFDFQNINVAEIRDSFEGNYFYKIKILKQLPKKYWGKMISIPVTLHEEYFDRLPGPDDVTKIHNYKLQIPPIKIGFPYPEGEHKGKVYETYGRANNVKLTTELINDMTIQGAKYIDATIEQQLRDATTKTETVYEKLYEIYESLPTPKDNELHYTENEIGGRKVIEFTFGDKYNTFPKENEGEPDTTEFKFLMYANTTQIPFGYQKILLNSYLNYTNIKRGKQLSTTLPYPEYRESNAKGPYWKLDKSYYMIVVDENKEWYEISETYIYPKIAGTFKATLYATNYGTDYVFKTKFKIDVSNTITLLPKELFLNYELVANYTIVDGYQLIIETNKVIAPGETLPISFFFDYVPPNTKTETGKKRTLDTDEVGIEIIKKIQILMDLNQGGTNTGIQTFEVPFYMDYNHNGPLYIGNPTLANIGDFENPEFIVSAIVMREDKQIASDKFCYRFYRRIETTGSIGDSYTPLTTGCSENPGIDDKPFEGFDMSKIDSYTVYYKIEIFKAGEYNPTMKTQPQTTAAIKYTTQREKDEEEKKKFPLTVIIIILAAVVVISAAFVIFCVLRNKKQKEEAKNNDVPIEDVVKSSDRQRVANRSDIASGIEVQRIEPIELEVSRNNK